jgi:signal transduction histidine kinase
MENIGLQFMPSDLKSILTNPQRLATLRKLALLDTQAEAAFDRLTELASKILRAPTALVSLVDADRQFFKSAIGLDEPVASDRGTQLSHSFCQYTLMSNEPLIIEDTRQHPLVKDNLAIPDFGVIAYAGVPLVMPDGSALGSFCVLDYQPRIWQADEIQYLKNLAALVMTEIALRSAYEREKELGELRSSFMSMVSHDFRTPLAVIQSSSDLLQLYGERLTGEQRQKHLSKIQGQVKHMAELLNDVMTISRAEAAEQTLVFTPINWLAFGRELADEAQLMAGTKCCVVFRCPNEQLNGLADASLLRRGIMNLLSNAIKYSPPDSRIDFEIDCEDSGIIIRVRDEGIGISDEDQKRLFEPFYRASNVGEIQGSGLGLAIVKQFVDAHGGTLEVESQLDAGTTFTIRLPESAV